MLRTITRWCATVAITLALVGGAALTDPPDRLFDLCRAVVLVYGGFLLGMLTHAWWEHDELVFWPWSLVFLLMIAGLVLWQSRRAPKARERVD